MAESTPSRDARNASSRVSSGFDTVVEVLTYKFTRNGLHKHESAFINAALYWMVAFGLLTLIFSTTPPLNNAFLIVAGGGFLCFILLELVAGISASVYQRGLFGFAHVAGFIAVGLMGILLLVVKKATQLFTLGLAGFAVFYQPLVWTLSYTPGLLHPVAILVYLAVSVAWMINGMAYVEGRETGNRHPDVPDVAVPPFGVVQWAVNRVRLAL